MKRAECSAQTVKVESKGLTRRFVFAYLLLFVFVALTMTLLMSHPAFAYSPHGPFNSDTDKCQSCHRMHLNAGDKLLSRTSVTDVCISCHAKGQGADTAVMEGLYVDGQGSAANHSWGTPGALLLGGGFLYIGGNQPVTGNHQIGVTAVPYGSGSGTGYTLGCQDCHTPHANDNYRLLRHQPGGVAADITVQFNGPWTDATQTAQGGEYNAYSIADFSAGNANGEKEFTRNYKAGIASWCAACHQRYMTRGWPDPDSYPAGDNYGSQPRYRHEVGCAITGENDEVNGVAYNLTTDLPLEDATGNGRTTDDRLTCLSCHAAHGTAAVMQGDAILGSDRGSLPAGANGLNLRTDGRELCGDCHNIAGG